MKKIILILVLTLSQATLANGLFDNLYSYVNVNNSNPKIVQAHRLLSIMARMSVYALICGSQQDNIEYSQSYRNLFTELSQGQVRFEQQTLLSPLESMRNQAMMDFINDRTQLGGNEEICERYRPAFNSYLNLSAAELKNLVRENKASERQLLMAQTQFNSNQE